MDENGAEYGVTGVISLAEAEERSSEILEKVISTGADFVVTVEGQPKAVILLYEEYESLVETIGILSDPDAMTALEESAADIKAGRLVDLAYLDLDD